MKSRFVVYYDYGMGGIIVFIYARSSHEIVNDYPELEILDELPSWFTPEHELKMATNGLTFDIDEPPTGFLEKVVRSREDTANNK